MPNRILKESIHDSEKVNRMTDFQFRLWVNLIPYVDDYGRGDARPAIIKGKCFPLRDRLTIKDIEAALNALADIGCVGLYEVDGKPYLYFPNWESHQRVQTKKSKYPAPPEKLSSPYSTVAHRDSPPESNPIQSKSESESKSNPIRGGFAPPSVEEVRAYCEARHSIVDPEEFVDFYESNGWMVGTSPMKDWKAKLRGWERKRKNEKEDPLDDGFETF